MIRTVATIRALVGMAAWLAGVPLLLVGFGGSPLPSRWPSAVQVQTWLEDPLRPLYVPGTARVVAWLIWMVPTVVIVVAGMVRVCRWRWARLIGYLPGPVQGLAATALGAATVTTAVGVPTAHAVQPAAAGTGPDRPAATPVSFSWEAATADGHTVRRDPAVVTVRRGDTLWDIADDRLGDPQRWPQIYRLNLRQHPRMAGGDHIEPGWTLTLPSRAPAGHRSSPPRPTARASTQPTTPPPRDGSRSAPYPDGADASAPSRPPTTGSAASPPLSHPRSSSMPGRDAHPGTGIALEGGSWIDAGLAMAIAAAAATVWTHRRRRYTRRPLSPDLRLDEQDLAPLPPVVARIRRQLRRAATKDPRPGGSDPIAPAVADHHGEKPADPRPDTPTTDQRDHGAGVSDGRDPDASAGGFALDGDPSALWPTGSRVVQPPDRARQENGLGLTGSGAQAAARGLLVAALAAGSADVAAECSQVIMPAPVARTLLGCDPAALPGTPRLTVTAGLEEALDLLETHVLRRSRLLDAQGYATITELRAADPAEERLPPVMLLAVADTSQQQARIAALLADGRRLDLRAMVLGSCPDGDTVAIRDDGTTTAPEGDASNGRLEVGRFTMLTAAEARQLLETLAESHTGRQHTGRAAPSEPTDAHCGAAADSGGGHRPMAPSAQNADQVTSSSAGTDVSGPQPQPGPDSGDSVQLAATAEDRNDVHGVPGEASRSRIGISVLGSAGISGQPAGTGMRKKSLELLVYLIVRDGAATTEAILDDVLGDAPARKAAGRLYTYVSDLRTVLRRTGGDGTYLTHPGHRYVLDRDAVDVDLWRMRAAIRDATHATEPDERQAALRRAVNAYGGPLADGADYDWIEPYREAVRRQALDACLELAKALTDQPAQQLTVLETAIRQHPYTEPLYQKAMEARAALGQIEAIRALRRTLTRTLADIDAEPGDDTLALADRLVAQLTAPRPQRRLSTASATETGATA